LSRPSLGAAEQAACRRVLRSGVLTSGPEVAAFERAFAERVGAPHAVATSSGTAALWLALAALDLGPDDEVVVPAHTFIACANAVRLHRARVVLADVADGDLNLDPAALARVVGSQTRAVLAVHQYGTPADLAAIARAAPQAVLIEDAACAVGAATAAGPVGAGPGRAACFSFHPRKTITTGEGGMLVTADAALAARVRALRQHGLGPRGFCEPGANLRLGELPAALGRAQLERLDELLARRRRVAARYAAGLAGLDWLQLPAAAPGAQPSHQSYVVRLRPAAPVSRDGLLAALRARGIGCQAAVAPVHHHPGYQDSARGPLPVAERAGSDGLFLPMHAELDPAQVERVCEALRTIGGCA
jgi:perosamine synthetase